MKKELLLKKLQTIENVGGFGVQALLDKEADGGCPCFSAKMKVDGEPFEVWGRCWRVSENVQDLNYYGSKEVAEAIKRCLDAQQWYNPYTLIEHDEPFL
jgi:hypothetical protein